MKRNPPGSMLPFTFALILGCAALLSCGRRDADPEPEAPSQRPMQVAITPAQVEASAIEVLSAGPANLGEALSLYGTVAPDAERVRDVAARYPGVIRSVRHRVGDVVRQGEVLATVEGNESLQTYPVVAPIGGAIASRAANVGEQTGDKPLFVVMDLSSVWVELSLFPRDAARVRPGQPVTVRSPVAEGSGEGRVIWVGPFSSGNQTLTARVQLPNAQGRWAPGLYVTGEVLLSEHPVAVAVRSAALQLIDDRPVVFVREGEGFAIRSVRTGRADSQFTEILAGVAPGESYAAANSYVLKAEALKGEAAED